MKIDGWECTVGLNNDRAASHPEGGTLAFFGGHLMGHGDAPRAVVAWLLRPQLAEAWHGALRCAELVGSTHLARQGCPFDGELAHKDEDPS